MGVGLAVKVTVGTDGQVGGVLIILLYEPHPASGGGYGSL